MHRIPVDVGVAIYKQTPTASWSLDLLPPGQPRRRISLKIKDTKRALTVARDHARALASGLWNVTMAGTGLREAIRAYLDQRKRKCAEADRKPVKWGRPARKLDIGLVRSLRDQGLGVRRIARAVGASVGRVHKALTTGE